MKKKILILLALLMALTLVFVACKDDPVPPEDTTVADQPTEEPTQGGEEPTPDTNPDPEETTAPDEAGSQEPETNENTQKPEDPTDPVEPPTQEPETDDPMEPVNVFEAADIQTVTGGDPNNMTQDCLTLEDGFVHIVPIGPDPYYYPFAGVDGARYVAIRYRTDATGADMQLYISSTGTGPQDDSTMIRQPVIADGEWHVIVFDTQSLIDAGLYNGEYVSYFRFDPLEAGYILDENGEPYKEENGQWARYSLPEGCMIDVAYIGFFHTEAAVAKYDFEQYPPFVQPGDAGLKNASFDTFYVNGQMYFPDGGASDKLNEINNTLSFNSASELQSILLRGWIGFEQAIDSFGYYVDNYDFVFDASFAKEAEAGVINAGGEFASRFEIKVPLDYFEGNDHFVGFVVKLADGTVVQLRPTHITIDLPELPEDIADGFVSDVNSNEIGTSHDASDLSNFFVVELPLGGCSVVANGDGKMYHQTSISDFYADVNGRNYIKANIIQTNANAWMFTRAYKVVNSDEVIEKYNPEGGIYKINNFYETDSAGSMGGAGIYARIDGGKLYINVKYYNPDTITRVGNKGYIIEAEGSELTLADSGSTVSVMVDGVTYATIALSGSVTYDDINEVQPKNGFAEKAVITLKNGTTETVENTLIADTCEYQVGVVARSGDFKFDMIAVGGYSAIEVPELEIVEPDDPAPIDPNAPAHSITADMIHATATSGGGATVNNQIASSEIITEDGYTFVRLKSNGGDPYVAVVGIGENLILPQYMAISYRNNSSANGQMFIGSGGGWSGQGDSFTLDWTDTNVWSHMIVDLTNCGVSSITGGLINYARLDFFAGETGEDTYFDVEYIAFFDSVDAAQKYYNKLRGIEDDVPAVEHDFVAEGLVALYDGSLNNRNGHDTSANVWQDLVGNNHINVTIDENNYFTDKGLVVNSVKNFFPAGIVNTINGNAYTVEINMADLKLIGKDFATLVNSEGDRFALFYRTSNGVLEFKFAGCPGNQRNIIQNALPMLSDTVITITYEVGGNSTIYINGELASTMPAQGAMEAPDLFFGHSDEPKKFEALFRGFRFYDRALTAEEVKHNANVDMGIVEPEPDDPEKPEVAYKNETIVLAERAGGGPFSTTKTFGQRYNIGENILKTITIENMATYDDDNVNTWSLKVWQWNTDYATTVAAEPLFVKLGENHANNTHFSVLIQDVEIKGDFYYEVEYLTGAKQFTGWAAQGAVVEGLQTYAGGTLRDDNYASSIIIGVPYDPNAPIADITNKFASNVGSNAEETDIRDSDLKNYFTIVYGAADPHVVRNGMYIFGGINEMFAKADGLYAFSANIQGAVVMQDTLFVRGYHAVNFPENPTMLVNNYYEDDGDGSTGGAGIYVTVKGDVLYIVVKAFNGDKSKGIQNYIYQLPANGGTNVTIADDGKVVYVILEGKLMATVALSGETTYDRITLPLDPGSTFAKTAVVTLADGTTATIEDTLVASSYISQFGIVARGGQINFWSTDVKGISEIEIPEFESSAPATPEEIVDAAYALPEGATLDGTYTLTGVITDIESAWSDQYQNISVWMQIGDMSDKLILAFRVAGEGASTLKKGDTITVTGSLTNYQGKIEFAQGCTLDAVVPGEEPEPEDPSIPGMKNESINFGDYTFRTEEGSDYQIFTNGDFVFTQAKGSSNNWNTSYIGPIRLYVGHDVTIAYPGMTKIVIDGNSGKPQTGWVDSISDSNATVTIDGTTVTIEFATPVDSFTVTFVAQVRVNAITVYAPSADEPDAPAGGEITATTTDTYAWIDLVQFTATVSGTYTFNLPAGLGAWDAVKYDTDWSSMPIVDFYENAEGASFTIDIAAGNTYSFYVGAITKDAWVITWTVVEGEVGGGSDEPDPEDPVEETLVLTVGTNAITVTENQYAEGGMSATIEITEAGEYKFSGDFLVRIYNGMGVMVGTGTAYLDPGIYDLQIVTAYLSGAGTYNLRVEVIIPEEPDPEVPEIPENPVIESLPFTYEVPAEGLSMDGVYYNYTAGEETTLVITSPDGIYVTPTATNNWDTDEDGNFILVVNAGETIVLNIWAMSTDTTGTVTVTAQGA